MMHPIIIRFFCVIIAFATLSSCKSYQVVPNGFSVEGDEYFVNLNKELTVFLYPSYEVQALCFSTIFLKF